MCLRVADTEKGVLRNHIMSVTRLHETLDSSVKEIGQNTFNNWIICINTFFKEKRDHHSQNVYEKYCGISLT